MNAVHFLDAEKNPNGHVIVYNTMLLRWLLYRTIDFIEIEHFANGPRESCNNKIIQFALNLYFKNELCDSVLPRSCIVFAKPVVVCAATLEKCYT